MQTASTSASLPALVRLLRRHCEAARVGGGLLFDGEWVVMLFEGAAVPLEQLLELVSTAPQLEPGLQMLATVPLPGATVPGERWIAGYAEPELLAGLLPRGQAADAMVRAFKDALGNSDAL